MPRLRRTQQQRAGMRRLPTNSTRTTRTTPLMPGWSGSNRRQRLPKDWPQRRAAAKAKADGMCQAKIHEPDCNGIGSECDHVIAGDNHALNNLQWLSKPCHAAKTLREAQWHNVGRIRPPEPHPGQTHPKITKKL